MKHIYLLCYYGGFCGDFVTLEISKDENYYTNALAFKTDTNRWVGENPLRDFGLDYKEMVLPISKELKDRIDLHFQDKNLVVPSHFNPRANLPRLKKIRVYPQDTTYIPLFFIMMHIKAYTVRRDFDTVPKSLPLLGEMQQDHYLMHRYLSYYIGRPNKLTQARINHIHERGYYYRFEMVVLKEFRANKQDVIRDFYPAYVQSSLRYWPSAVSLPVDQLITKPKENVGWLSKELDMAEPFNIERIESYQHDNMSLIESTFNKPYHTLIQEDWLGDLTSYMKEACPGSWLSRSD
jgi:hypothetical protein